MVEFVLTDWSRSKPRPQFECPNANQPGLQLFIDSKKWKYIHYLPIHELIIGSQTEAGQQTADWILGNRWSSLPSSGWRVVGGGGRRRIFDRLVVRSPIVGFLAPLSQLNASSRVVITQTIGADS